MNTKKVTLWRGRQREEHPNSEKEDFEKCEVNVTEPIKGTVKTIQALKSIGSRSILTTAIEETVY